MKKNGFTLLEILVTIAVIATMATLLLPAFRAMKQRPPVTQTPSPATNYPPAE